MVSSDYIIVNGVSSDTVDLWVDTPPAPPMAEQRANTYQTGYDTDLVQLEDTYKDMTITVRCFVMLPSDYDNAAIYDFLQSARTLQTSRYSDKYYKVRYVKSITPQVKYDGSRIDYSISFVVAPFKYSVSNEPIAVTNGGYLSVSGTHFARPIFRITPSGTGFALIVNGVTFTSGSTALTPGAEYVVDSERMIVYTGTTIIHGTVGKYPLFAVGQNQIAWEGTLTVTVQRNERWR